jgi:hypothetical protein
MEQNTHNDYHDGDSEMDTSIALCAQRVPKSIKGMTKAGDKL